MFLSIMFPKAFVLSFISLSFPSNVSTLTSKLPWQYTHFILNYYFYLVLKAIIFIRFVSSHSRSVLYKLTDPALLLRKQQSGVYWNRYQTENDRQIFKTCTSLKRKECIYNAIIDKNHVTNVIMKKGSRPLAIWDSRRYFTCSRSRPLPSPSSRNTMVTPLEMLLLLVMATLEMLLLLLCRCTTLSPTLNKLYYSPGTPEHTRLLFSSFSFHHWNHFRCYLILLNQGEATLKKKRKNLGKFPK